MNAIQQDAAPAASQGLFRGIAVVIDDQVKQAGDGDPDEIEEILASIKRAGGHAVVLPALPAEDDNLDGFANAAFFIMDWNLQGANVREALQDVPGLDLGGLRDTYEEQNVRFLKKLRSRRHAPVFIMTNESVDHVTRYLRDNGVMGAESGAHIMVKSKTEVGSDLYDVLDGWLKETPSAWLLKQWEQNQIEAMNSLFNEFYDRNQYWPVIFWNTYKKDEVSPHAELGELINRLVDARMKPLTLDLSTFAEQADAHFGVNAQGYKQSIYAVLQSERLLPNSALDPDEYAPGDLFLDPNNNSPRLLLNVRPACDCVQREGFTDDKMYCIRGIELDEQRLAGLIDDQNGNIREKDGETIVFALKDGKSVCFSYRNIYQVRFAHQRANRLGRVLPPFLTKITQRYAAYSHRAGLPRIPLALMPQGMVVIADAPANVECDCDLKPANAEQGAAD